MLDTSRYLDDEVVVQDHEMYENEQVLSCLSRLVLSCLVVVLSCLVLWLFCLVLWLSCIFDCLLIASSRFVSFLSRLVSSLVWSCCIFFVTLFFHLSSLLHLFLSLCLFICLAH
jgi:hypothetical protein